jgi:hypothetical protein
MNTQNIELNKAIKDMQNAAIQASKCLEKQNADMARIAIKAKEHFDATIAADLEKIQKNVKSALENFSKTAAPTIDKCGKFAESMVRNMQALDQAKKRKR